MCARIRARLKSSLVWSLAHSSTSGATAKPAMFSYLRSDNHETIIVPTSNDYLSSSDLQLQSICKLA